MGRAAPVRAVRWATGRHGQFQCDARTHADLQLTELKPNDPIIVVCTEGAKPSEVTAITILTGVEPILAARPKGGDMNLGSWNLGMGAAEAARASSIVRPQACFRLKILRNVGFSQENSSPVAFGRSRPIEPPRARFRATGHRDALVRFVRHWRNEMPLLQRR